MRKRQLARLRNQLAEALVREAHPVADETHTLDGTDEMVSLEAALEIADDFMALAAMGPIAQLRTTLPFSRPCYDKPHRCPGRAGGGMQWALIARCQKGMLSAPYYRRYWLGTRCPDCGLYVLPIAVEWLDFRYRVRHPRWPWWLNPKEIRIRTAVWKEYR
jgi:hypothetical protein